MASEQSSTEEKSNPYEIDLKTRLKEKSINEVEEELLEKFWNIPLDEAHKNEKDAIDKALAQIENLKMDESALYKLMNSSS